MTTTSPRTTTMAAIVQREYGEADQLSPGRLPVPEPGKGEVRVRVHAAALNPADKFMMRGKPRILRLGAGMFRPSNPVRGTDGAGVIDAVGPGVTDVQPGDRVFGELRGSLAEFAVAKANRLAPLPASVPFDQGAATVMAGLAALHGLETRGVEAGERVLVIGASGGIGSFAVQMAKARGAHVTGVCSGRNADAVRRLGADEVIDYTQEHVTQRDERWDLIFDNVGAAPMMELERLTTPTGVVLPNSGEPGPDGGAIRRVVKASLLGRLLRRRIGSFYSAPNRADLERLATMLEDGTIAPLIDSTLPLERGSEAMARVCSRHASGKVVVTL